MSSPAENITNAIFARLNGDATLIAMLAQKQSGSRPAIYTGWPVPTDSEFPYLVQYIISMLPFDTKNTRGFECWLDVNCYDDAKGSSLRVDQIADRVYTLLHRQPITPTGMMPSFMIECSGPSWLDSDPDYQARTVGVHLKVHET